MGTIDYNGSKVLVIGLGVSGQAAASFLVDHGAMVTAVDRGPSNGFFPRFKVFSDDASLDVSPFDFVVISPGVRSDHPLVLAAQDKNIPVISEIELASRHLTQSIIGVTGTNGKTTVCYMIAHVLNRIGKKACVLGNAGTPLISAVSSLAEEEIIVCELSSYQLESLKSEFIDLGIILNISPDHLDRYKSMDEYAISKIHLGSCLKAEGKLLVNKNTYESYCQFFNNHLVATFGRGSDCDVYFHDNSVFINKTIELFLPNKYRGKFNHDVENMMAAFWACHQYGISPRQFLENVTTFIKPKHRLEFVKEIEGISFYNDSKGTNLDAVIRAVDSMIGDVVLIVGGQSKGVGFSSWLEPFDQKVKAIFAIGEATNQLIHDLSKKFHVVGCKSLESAVHSAFSIAEQGNCVLFSPGCASFDMFDNFEHRGNCFVEIVHTLE